MSKVCVFCGKGGIKRKNGRHTARGKSFSNFGPHGMKAVKSIVSIRPNFREVRLEKGMPKVTACMRCYKTVKKSVQTVPAAK